MMLSSFIRVSFGFYRVIANPFSFRETQHFLGWGEEKHQNVNTADDATQAKRGDRKQINSAPNT